MAYDKPKVTIDLNEYNELLDPEKNFYAQLYKKCITALINTKGNVEAANFMLVGTQYMIEVGSKRTYIDPSYPPYIPGEIIPMEAIKITPINNPNK